MAKITIDKACCKGCNICIAACPKELFIHSKNRNNYGTNMPEIVHEELCAHCGMCERMCPDGAIDVIAEESL